VRALAGAFNMLTAQQPWAAERLARHSGKTLRITLSGFAVTMTIESDGRLTRADSAVVPDVVLEVIAEKLTFDRLFATKSSMDVAELINISGQASLAQLVSDLARDLRPEPEDALASLIGDLPANKLMQSAQSLLQAFKGFSRGLAQNTAEYLAEETNALAGQPVLALHAQRVVSLASSTDALSDRHASLSTRLDRLSSKRQHA
jgi:ubiquinone biosynthesis protein UbiJ